MKPLFHFCSVIATGLALGASLIPAHSQVPWATEGFSRQNKAEVYGIGQYLHQDDVEYNGPYGAKTRMSIDDTGLGGIGIAFHINDFLAVHADFMLGPADFTITEPSGYSYSLGHDGFISSGRFNVDYNIINRRLTPFLTAGIGYQYMQADQYYYYGGYHGWYYPYYDYYSETDFTWNVGAGVRWNILDNFFIKATAGAQWVLYHDADNLPMQFEASFAIGGTFP